MSAATIALVLQVLNGLLTAGPAIVEQTQALIAKLEQFQAEGRDPTPEEFRALFAAIDVDEAAIDAAFARISAN